MKYAYMSVCLVKFVNTSHIFVFKSRKGRGESSIWTWDCSGSFNEVDAEGWIPVVFFWTHLLKSEEGESQMIEVNYSSSWTSSTSTLLVTVDVFTTKDWKTAKLQQCYFACIVSFQLFSLWCGLLLCSSEFILKFQKFYLVGGNPAHVMNVGTRYSVRSLPTLATLWFINILFFFFLHPSHMALIKKQNKTP